jgi:hypothetical protein
MRGSINPGNHPRDFASDQELRAASGAGALALVIPPDLGERVSRVRGC